MNALINCKIQYSCCQYYTKYEKIMGASNCTYSVHLICSHLLQMREKGPLTSHSAFPFEEFYSQLRHSFCPGTISPLKQMVQNVLLKKTLASHKCERSIYLSPKDTVLENNSQIYCFEKKNSPPLSNYRN